MGAVDLCRPRHSLRGASGAPLVSIAWALIVLAGCPFAAGGEDLPVSAAEERFSAGDLEFFQAFDPSFLGGVFVASA